MQITAATQADKAAWLPLWQAYLDFYNHPLADEITDLTFGRMVDPTERMGLLLARTHGDGEVVGFVTYILHRSTWARDSYCYLEDLYVAEAMRSKGAGRALIEAVATAAKAEGAERLYWITEGANTTAQALYRKIATETDYIQYRRTL